jgi:hypothetical protein
MNRGYDLPFHVAQAVQREVGTEPVLWVGQPDAGLVFRSSLVIWLFGIPWTGFTLMWEAVAISPFLSPWLISPESLPKAAKTASLFMVLWGLPFVAIGLGMMAAPFWVHREARNQAHAVTDRNIYSVTAHRGGSRKIDKTDIAKITHIERIERPTGFGTLKIYRGKTRDSEGDLVDDFDTWIGIPDVHRVDGLITGLMRKKSA